MRKPMVIVADVLLLGFLVSVILTTSLGQPVGSLGWAWWLASAGTFAVLLELGWQVSRLAEEVVRLRRLAMRYRATVDVVTTAVQMDVSGLETRSMVGVLANDRLTALWREQEAKRADLWDRRTEEGDVSGR